MRFVGRRLPAGMVIAALFALALWPAVRWYALRLAEPGDDRFGLIALAALVLYAWRRGASAVADAVPRLSIILLVAAAILQRWLPALLYALLGVFAVVAWLSVRCRNRPLDPGLLALGCLALPLLPSLQFYLGYPLRVFAASLAAGLLRFAGYAVDRQGVLLEWGGKLISVDVPCSGVRMLWAIWLLTALLLARQTVSWRTAARGYAVATGAIVLGNALRAVLLFLPESGVVTMPAAYHEIIGVALFVVIASVLTLIMPRPIAPCSA